MITFGLVGNGNIGKRHAAIINEKASLSWICDINGSGNYTDILEAIKNKVDIVVIATPNYLHFQHSLLAIRNGFDVIIEKPTTLTTSECGILINQAKKHNVNIFSVKQNRLSDPIKWIKSNIENLGKVYQIQVNCFWNRGEGYYNESEWRSSKLKSGGVVFTQFSHFIDILYHLFGYCEVVYKQISKEAHDYTDFHDSGIVLFKTESNTKGSFSYSTNSTNKNLESSITIIAENATIKIAGQYMNDIIFCEGIEKPTFEEIKPNQYASYQGSASNHDKLYDQIIKFKEGNESYLVNTKEMQPVIDMCVKFS